LHSTTVKHHLLFCAGVIDW